MKMLENDDKKVSLSPGSNTRPLDVIAATAEKVWHTVSFSDCPNHLRPLPNSQILSCSWVTHFFVELPHEVGTCRLYPNLVQIKESDSEPLCNHKRKMTQCARLFQLIVVRHPEVLGSSLPQGGTFFLTFLVLFVDFCITNLFSPNLR